MSITSTEPLLTKAQESTHQSDPVDKQPTHSSQESDHGSTLVARLERALNADVSEVDQLLSEEIDLILEQGQSSEWAEMLRCSHDQLIDDFVHEISGEDQESF